jgi:hypothetical protein
MMSSNGEANRRRRFSLKTVLIAIIVIVAVVTSAWALLTVSTTSQLLPSDFVTMPTTLLSRNGTSVVFVSVGAISEKGVAVGVKGYLETGSGQPVVGAKVYARYYLNGDYRTQVATTDQNGYFQINFPMNWTGWLPVTLTYFGDSQHQGQAAVYSLAGENL